MSYKPTYPIINIWMFINDWNCKMPSSMMARIYSLKTVSRVNCYANKLRKDGHILFARKRGPGRRPKNDFC